MFYRWCGVCVVSLFAFGNLKAETWVDHTGISASKNGGNMSMMIQVDLDNTGAPGGYTRFRLVWSYGGTITPDVPATSGGLRGSWTKNGTVYEKTPYNTTGSGTTSPDIQLNGTTITIDISWQLYSVGGWTSEASATWTAASPPPEPKKVIVYFVNNDDRDWFATFDGEEGPRAVTVPYGANNSMELEEDELPDVAKYGVLAATRTMRELHKGEWYLASGTFYDSNSEAGNTHTYQYKLSWGPLAKADAKDPPNTFTVTIGDGTAKNADVSRVNSESSSWVVSPPSEDNPDPVAPVVEVTKGPLPAEEVAKKVNQYLTKTIDPDTGESRLVGYFGPLTGTATPTTGDGEAIVEALGEIQGRSEKMHQLGILQGEDGAQVAKGQLGALEGAVTAGQGMGGEGEGAGTAAAALFGEAPGALGYTVGAGTAPNLSVSMPATFGGGTFNLNPFTNDRLGPIAGWFRQAVAWLAIVVLGGWVWSQMGEWVRGISTLPQAKGNAVIGGTGGQATALVAAGLMTTAIVVAITALLSWSFGDITIPSLISAGLSNPMTSMPSGVLWMVDQLFPVGTLIVCVVARVTFNIYAAGLFATCAAVVRFIVP